MRFPRRIPRPSAAMLVASAALFAAVGGTSYAALMVTGANVANGSLTGADMANKSIGGKKLKKNTIGGTRVKESSLGTVPSAAQAADADKLDGLDSAAFMKAQQRLYEADFGNAGNFGDGAILGTLDPIPAGQYLVTSKFGYDNDGPQEIESCTLHVPGADDTVGIFPEQQDTVVLEKTVSSASDFAATVTCTGDGNDDMIGNLSIIAVRVD
jgi:hypothetical protein